VVVFEVVFVGVRLNPTARHGPAVRVAVVDRIAVAVRAAVGVRRWLRVRELEADLADRQPANDAGLA
jgi:hypothetical protein